MTSFDMTTVAGQAAHYREVRRRINAPRFAAKQVVVEQVVEEVVETEVMLPDVDGIGTYPWPNWPSGADVPNTIKRIQKLVACHFGLTVNDLVSERRAARICHARHVAIFLAKEMTPLSLPAIGRRFGDRDHTTVLHAVSKIERLRHECADVAAAVETLRAMLREQV